mgnify:CR=1 FL=1
MIFFSISHITEVDLNNPYYLMVTDKNHYVDNPKVIKLSNFTIFKNKKVKEHLAMTGEITLRGKVLPVGGIKEKLLAAARAGIKEIILCEANRKDVEEIKKDYLKNLKVNYVSRMSEVIELAIEK